MGAAAGSGVVGPKGNFRCCYCNCWKHFIGVPDLHKHEPVPVLRDPRYYAAIAAEVSTLRAKGHGYQGKADQLLTDTGYTEGIISYI